MHLSRKLKIIETTPFGPVGIVWSEIAGSPRVLRVLLPGVGPPRPPKADADSCPEIEEIAGALGGILAGRAVEIPGGLAALELCSPFQRAVLKAAAKIPRGTVATYGSLAAGLGWGGAARAAGNALAANPFPLIFPCHRVIRSDGRIGGFTGGAELKRKLLELEGVRFDGGGGLIR